MEKIAKKILLIQPRANARSMLARRIGEAGHTVIEANTALDALATLQREAVDLVLTELRLPGRDAIEFTRLVREQAAHEDLPILVIAGRREGGAAVEAYAAGADDVIAKPFDTDVLIARIARRLAKADAFHALRHDNARLDARVIERAIALGELRDEMKALRLGRPA